MILIHVDNLNGINYHRLIAPFTRMMETTDLKFYWFETLEEIKIYNLEIVSHIIISRKLAIVNYKAFRDMLDKYGVKLVLDIDDFWELTSDNPAYLVYELYMGKRIKETIRIADEVWSPSKYLAKMTRRVNRKVSVKIIPNGINPDEAQWSDIQKYGSEELKFGYIGANGHSKDVGLIGYNFSNKELYCVDLMDYVELLGAKHKLDPKPVFEYGTLYKNFNVSIAPLGGGRFNRSKSNLKVVEAAFTKTAIIASNTSPYKEYIEHGKTGLLCANKDEWKEAIESMTVEHARELGNNLYESMKDEYHIDTINNLRLQALYGDNHPNSNNK